MMNAVIDKHTPVRRRHAVRRWLLRALLVLVVLLVGAELFCRYRLGLGDPPLVMTDPQIEYLFQPSKVYHRFGNTVAFNRWSMRSDDFAEHKTDPKELRLLVIGDSVVNGGAQTDQHDLASEIVKRDLHERLHRPVVVGNISAGSWGPPNMLAYVRKFGLFDADVVVIVLSSHDWNDVPTFKALPPDFPTHKPLLALQEAITRYLPRYLPASLGGTGSSSATSQPTEPGPDDPDVVASLSALTGLIQLAQLSKAKVIVAQHLERDESPESPKPGHKAIAATASAAGVSVMQIGPSFEQARRAGDDPYRDNIHPNQLGQRIIAKMIEDWVVANTREGAP